MLSWTDSDARCNCENMAAAYGFQLSLLNESVPRTTARASCQASSERWSRTAYDGHRRTEATHHFRAGLTVLPAIAPRTHTRSPLTAYRSPLTAYRSPRDPRHLASRMLPTDNQKVSS